MGSKKRKRFFQASNRQTTIDPAWLCLAIFVILAPVAVLLIRNGEWWYATPTLAFLIFVAYFALRFPVFAPWAYRIRRAQAARRQAKWDKLDRLLQVSRQSAERYAQFDMRRGMILFHIADIQRERARYAEAVSLFEEALEIFHHQKNEKLLETSIAANNLAVCHYSCGRFDSAARYYHEALEAAEKSPRLRRIRPICLHNLARLHLERGEWEEADWLLAQAEAALGRNAAGNPCQSVINATWSELALRNGDLHDAEDLAQRALKLAKAIGPNAAAAVAWALTALAEVRRRQGDLDKSYDNATEALQLQHFLSDRENPHDSRLYFLLAEIAVADGDDAQAEEYFRHGFALREQFGFPDTYSVSHPLQVFAALLRRKGHDEEAAYFEQRARHLTQVERYSIASAARADSEASHLAAISGSGRYPGRMSR